MIKIKIEAASGADLRMQLIALLGGLNETVTITGDDVMHTLNLREPVVKQLVPEQPIAPTPATEEKTSTKKLTKAQIAAAEKEAAVNAEATNQEGGTDDTPAEEVSNDNANQNADDIIVTFEVLRDMTLRLSRQGKKEETKEIITSFGVERITDMSKDQWPAYHAAILPMYNELPEEK